MMSTGRSCNHRSAVRPVPKSSIDTFTPYSLTASSSSMALTTSSINTSSLISISRQLDSSPCTPSARSISDNKRPDFSNCSDTLSENTMSSDPVWRQCATWRQVSSNICKSIRLINPAVLATGKKSPGDNRPLLGCCQRTRASAPTKRPSSRFTRG